MPLEEAGGGSRTGKKENMSCDAGQITLVNPTRLSGGKMLSELSCVGLRCQGL